VSRKHCVICKKPLPGARRRYCDTPCVEVGRRQRRARPKVRAKCRVCGKRFTRVRRGQKFCSGRCRLVDWRQTAQDVKFRRTVRRLFRKDLQAIARRETWASGDKQQITTLLREQEAGTDLASRATRD